jgi:hypothetical protein
VLKCCNGVFRHHLCLQNFISSLIICRIVCLFCNKFHPIPQHFYTKKVGIQLIILFLYVYDLILTGSDPKLLNHVKSSLKKNFEMTNLSYLHYFLHLRLLQSKEFPFPSISMHVTLFNSFTWKIVNQPHLPSNLESNFLVNLMVLLKIRDNS